MDETATLAASPPAPAGERRQVSVLFADMVGYTAIVERLGEERALSFARMIYETLTAAVSRHGGTPRGYGGDSIMAVFGIPEAQEDAALRACRAALSIQAAFATSADAIEAEFGVRPRMRVGVSSGTAVMAPVEGASGPLTAVGSTVNLASRVQALAPPGGCLICDTTRRLVEWLVDMSFHGERRIKGVSKPQKLWRLLSIREGATRFDASLARGLSRFLGRDEELRTLFEAFRAAEKEVRVADVVGDPGLGKTRLVFEFLEKAKGEAFTLLRGQCSTHGQQVPFFPFLEIVRGAFRILDEDEPAEIAGKLEEGLRRFGLHSPEALGLLLNLLGLKGPQGALAGLDGVLVGLRTRDLLTSLLVARCRSGKVVLILEDVHWIDGASEEVFQRLIETHGLSNLLVVHTRRPDYEPRWRRSGCVTQVALAPLNADQIRDLARTRLGVDSLPDALIRQLTERADGNPLFGEEILNFLIEEGTLRVGPDGVAFDAAPGASALPASMQGLFAAKVDRLPRPERALLEAAAVIGRRFDPGLLSLIDREGEATGGALRRLQAQDFIHPEPDASDYVFKHVLLRDSVYQSLLAERRAALHLSVAQALERRNEGRLAEVAEALAYHYSQTRRADLAFTYNALAGAKSLGFFSLGEADRYFAAALALYRSDPSCAASDRFAAFLADYALCLNISLDVRTMIELADEVGPILRRLGDGRHHLHFLHHYVSCLVWSGRYLDALRVRRDLSAMAERLGDPEARAYGLVTELAVATYCEPLSDEAFQSKKREAEDCLARIGDPYLQNYFLAHVGWNAITCGRVAEAREAAEAMIVAGVSMNDPRSLGYGTAMKALIAMLSADYEAALDLSEQALAVSRAEFEKAIAAAARTSALVPLRGTAAVEEVERYVAFCTERDWGLMASGPETMLGVALALSGRLDEGVRHLEKLIIRHEQDGRQAGADWARLFLCEIYLAVLAGQGGGAPGVLLRNLRSLSRIVFFGEKEVLRLLEKVRANRQFDPDGHFHGSAEMVLGLVYKAKRKRALAARHLTEARRIIGAFGPSPMLDRIEAALAELETPRR